MFSVREFLNAIAEALAERGTTSRELLSLQFEAESGNLRVVVGRERRPTNYPSLEDILRMVCHTCEEHGIGVSELERITFLDADINLECVRFEGKAFYTFPIQASTVH
jgi:hypothetical protein